MTSRIRIQKPATVMLAVLMAWSPVWAQTKITPDRNKYSTAQDIELGQEAAAEARKQLPMLNDNRVDEYVEDIGRRLAGAIPAELRHPGFEYTFDVVNQKEINAFALPGGPMFLNRGMIEAAKTEAEVAGVMAHEISHVALRHGTAQATKGERFQLGALAGQVLGAVIGGAAGSIIAQGSQFGLGAYFLKYGREYEREADLLGAQIMARAGYDPRQMANMFRTIEAQGGGSGGPEWLSSHPNPGNRYDAINREAAMLQVNGRAGDNAEFQAIKARLGGMSPAYTAEQIARGQARSGSGNGNSRTGTARRPVTDVEPPSGQYRTHQPAQFIRLTVPANWMPIGSSEGVTYAPEGGITRGQDGANAFTHGMQFGVVEGASGNLQRDTEQLLQGFARTNPDLRRRGGYSRVSVGGRQGLTTTLSNTSHVTGEREYINLTTAPLRDGRLLFAIGVAPEAEAEVYQDAFARVRQSVRLAD